MMRCFMLLLLYVPAIQLSAQEKLKLQVEQTGPKPADVAAYAIGYDLGTQLKSGGLQLNDINSNDFLAGFVDAVKGIEVRVPSQEIDAAMKVLSGKIQLRMQELAKASLAKASVFLDENKKKQGITALPSGLQFEVLKSGGGAMPTVASTVVVHYEGKLVNGKVFDSSIQRGEPTTFPVGQVIQGWQEALARMKVGDKWRLFVPPMLAYGEPGYPPAIGPNEALIFEIELLQVKQ